ncbi:HNH endonuclease [uncultured Nocardioides sp.]|jgi:5-methylcytosine-specific restriction endonuclease McrA|uniref:HNH endonuclease n=1 Tax=uncultured Nocardioides sp. TaxID=198441 RepID=UPI000C534A83|nr:HNH endonuclease signature motif containing protein [uncultured Nocardioides sp.]MAO81646.1 endonuclease [Nocardioides sp.]
MVSRSRSATYARRRKRRMAAVVHDLTAAQWDGLVAAWAGCAYCGAEGRALQKDCMLPISRGGRYTLLNVVPACGSCNASKCNLELTTWMRLKRMDERGFWERQTAIVRDLAPPVAP